MSHQIFTQTHKPSGEYRYVSFTNQIRNNGDRHAEKAKKWLALGKPEYAKGSMRKAQRNWEKAAKVEEIFRPKSSLEEFLIRDLTKRINHTLFYGNSRDNGSGGLACLVDQS